MKRVVVAVSQREYAAKLAEYLREEEPGWNIAAYTHDSALRREFQENRTVDLLIGQPEFLRMASSENGKVTTFLALVEEKGNGGGLWPEAIQYQPLPAILSSIRNGLGLTMSASVPDCQVLTVFSPTGGTGKTTAVLNLIRQAGERGLRTFYLNLEALNATSLLFGKGEPDSLSRLLYALQTHPEDWSSLLKQLCRHQPQLRTDYLDAPDHPGERLALTSELVKLLLDKIRETGRYDLIVIDPDSGAGEWHRDLLQISDKIIWLVLDDAQMLLKSEKLLRYWQMHFTKIMHKILFVLNKANPGGLLNQWNLPDAAPALSLPYIPQWKTIDQPGRLLASPSYAGAIDQLLNALDMGGSTPNEKRRREGSHGIHRTGARGAV
ncbi:nucleotide-binding protein [Cohnella cholangitidis]|uniref:CobQ/CobB/MinD/ParA nucleotide binding domain-containing protein n=1 Tax=Cohnella cholangitidis TaxID=2598458 RepID=A0A7G5C2C2_9BACL|nr:hypothetical protein [Cohnella cholangitidis]QMV43356.1 hypothetical protein FPL14_20905 [Cohnella cholangitidis]